MEIEKMKDKKVELELKILRLVDEFEDETKVRVDEITLSTDYTIVGSYVNVKTCTLEISL